MLVSSYQRAWTESLQTQDCFFFLFAVHVNGRQRTGKNLRTVQQRTDGIIVHSKVSYESTTHLIYKRSQQLGLLLRLGHQQVKHRLHRLLLQELEVVPTERIERGHKSIVPGQECWLENRASPVQLSLNNPLLVWG